MMFGIVSPSLAFGSESAQAAKLKATVSRSVRRIGPGE
jgi:hypothetical protein